MPESPFILLAIGLIFLVAGFVKGVIGLGLPTISMGLLSLVMLPAQAASLLVVPSFLSNIWQLSGPRFVLLLKRIWPMLAGICAGNWAGSGLLVGDSAGRATAWLGVALLAYAAIGLSGWHAHVSKQTDRWMSPLIGLTTGLLTAATGMFVLPAVPYLQALGLEKDDLVQAFGISALVSTLALAADLLHSGAFASSTAVLSGLALVAALAGMAIGQWLRRYIPPLVFRRWLFIGLGLLGAHLLVRHLL
jgi:uncharacterized protein